jgi:hypothetical protein
MSLCDDLLVHIEERAGEPLPDHLAGHAASCETCRTAMERLECLAAGANVLAHVEAPTRLVDALKAMPRIAPSCERVVELLSRALDDEIDDEERQQLLAHLHECGSCRAVWGAFATLREIGSHTVVRSALESRLAIHPSRRIARERPRRKVFDLRLATAAAYLVAAATIVLVSNPATLARASNNGLETATLYTRAAVENRLASLERRGQDALATAEGWLKSQAAEAWQQARSLFLSHAANQPSGKRVVPGGDGGNP